MLGEYVGWARPADKGCAERAAVRTTASSCYGAKRLPPLLLCEAALPFSVAVALLLRRTNRCVARARSGALRVTEEGRRVAKEKESREKENHGLTAKPTPPQGNRSCCCGSSCGSCPSCCPRNRPTPEGRMGTPCARARLPSHPHHDISVNRRIRTFQSLATVKELAKRSAYRSITALTTRTRFDALSS